MARDGSRREAPRAPRFVVDAMLGNVARDLRLLGYDALYAGARPDPEILRLTQAEGRTLVTRDRALAGRAGSLACVWVTERDTGRQTAQVLRTLGVTPARAAAFTRCLECNTPLEPITREKASGRTPDHVAISHESFAWCPGCERVFWSGTHASRLAEKIDRILVSLHPERGRV